MGLDGVELVMEFEDEFDVTIEDEVAASLQTIGDVARYVTWQMRSKWPRVSCPTTKSFYEVRKLLCEKLAVKRRDIRPSTKLNGLIPRRLRRRIFKALSKRSLWVPELQLPLVMNWMGLVLVLASGIGVGVSSGLAGGIILGIIAGFITLYLMLAAFYWITLPLAVSFPSGYETIGDLVRRVTPNYDAKDEIDVRVLDRVRRIVSEQMGVPIEKLAPQTSFTKDLHID